MNTKYILGALGVVFLILGFTRLSSNKTQARVWLIVGFIFIAVSIYLSV